MSGVAHQRARAFGCERIPKLLASIRLRFSGGASPVARGFQNDRPAGTAVREKCSASQATSLVDTDWIVDCLHGQPVAVQTVLDLDTDGLAVSLISYGELYEGAYYARDPQAALAGVEAFLFGKDLLPLTRDIMQRFGMVRGALPRQLRNQVGDVDLLIAATALHHDLTLLTRNVRDFRHIPGLAIYQSR